MEQVNPVWVFLSAFFVSAFAGLAALLRLSSSLSTTKIISALLNSGLLGLAISLLWYNKFQDNIYFLIGVCVVSGLGGMSVVELFLTLIKKGGFSISIGKEEIKFPKEGDKHE